MNQAEMTLWFGGRELRGTIRYDLDSDTAPCFLLDRRFRLTGVTEEGGEALSYRIQKSPVKKPGRPEMLITVDTSNSNVYILSFQSKGFYRNPIHPNPFANRYNFFTGDKIALDDWYISFYPVLAYPQAERLARLERPGCNSLPAIVYGLESFRVFFSEPGEGCKLVSVTAPFINHFKILAVREGSYYTHTEGSFTTVFTEKKEREHAAHFAQANEEILEWYHQNLYAQKPFTGDFLFFSHHYCRQRNAFVRGVLMEYDLFPPVEENLCESFIPHELAHCWCCNREEPLSASGFLDEGGAEWSAQIYRQAHDPASFERHRINYLRECEPYWKRLHQNTDKVNAEPPNRHYLGFHFFNCIYEAYGLETVKRCIQHYALPDKQNLPTFLEQVKEQESEEIACFVQKQADEILTFFPSEKPLA